MSDTVATSSLSRFAPAPAARLSRAGRPVAGDLQQMVGSTSDADDVGSPPSARRSAERTSACDGGWIELELRFPPAELERFVPILGAMGGA